MTKPYPWYYAVNDRPVKIVELPGGGATILALDLATGAFVRDPSYWERVSNPGSSDIDSLTEREFTDRLQVLRASIVTKHVSSPMVWEQTGDGELPYRRSVNGRAFTIRVNDFPAEPLYTLLIDEDEIADRDDWPAQWHKPPTAGQ